MATTMADLHNGGTTFNTMGHDSHNSRTGRTQNGHGHDNSQGVIKEKAQDAYSYARKSLDRVVSPERRQDAYDSTRSFAKDRPILFSFLATQFIFDFLPVLLFTTFSVAVMTLAFGAALVFSLFWIGAALLVLLPTLLVTSSMAAFCWSWVMGTAMVVRWLYAHSPVGVTGDLHVDTAGKRFNIKKDEQGMDGSVDDTH